MRFRWLGPLPHPEAGRFLKCIVLPTVARSGRCFCFVGRHVMDDSAKGFIVRQNIVRYIDQLKSKPTPFSDMLLKLLAEEEAKQIKAAT
jgi:hypothetical protein